MTEDKIFNPDTINLVSINEDGLPEITTDAINFLSSLKNKKISIITFTGPIQTGKSFLANTLINNHSAFPKNTKGLVLYNHPITLENGTELLIIDSQGLNNSEEDSSSHKLFILSMLISTCILYNTKNEINDDDINFLTSLTNLSEQIYIYPENEKNKSNGNGNLSNNLKNYLPQFIWVIHDINNSQNKEPNDYLNDIISNNEKMEKFSKLFEHKSCIFLPNIKNEGEPNNIKINNIIEPSIQEISELYVNQTSALFNKIKEESTYKKINNFIIDGDSLFGILQNYLDSMNNKEIPIISSALENVLLSKAKTISEYNFENFKNKFSSILESKTPNDTNYIYKTYFSLQENELSTFCNEVNDTLTVKQTGDYLCKLLLRMQNELDNVLETNKEFYGEWYDNKYIEISQYLNDSSNMSIKNLDEIKNIFFNYKDIIANSLNNFLNIPHSEICKNLILIIQKILKDMVGEKIYKFGEEIEKVYIAYNEEKNKKIEELTNENKVLQETVNDSNKALQEKNAEWSTLNDNYLDIKNKLEKSKLKEKEISYDLDMEKQKYQKMDNYFQTQIKEKDNTISQLEEKISILNQEIADIKNENSKNNNKTEELNKENLKLQGEIERMKEIDNNKSKSTNEKNNESMTNIYFQNLFKNIQNTFLDFKGSVDKLDSENENIFKAKYLEILSKEIDNKFSNWIDEIKLFREDQIKTMNETYSKNVSKLQEEIGDLKLKITKINCESNEQYLENKALTTQIEVLNKEKEEVYELAKIKDSLINTQNETITIYGDKIKTLEKDKDFLELSLNNNIVNFKMKEDELDSLIMVMDGMLSRKKDKYEHNLSMLTPENKASVEALAKHYKLFK